MSRKPQPASPAELAILKILWKTESATAGDIRERLYPAGTPSDHGTVQTLLQRLERKLLIKRHRDQHPHAFRAIVSQSELAGWELEALAARLTDGSLVPFIMHAVDAKKLSAKDRREIRAILDRLS